MGRRTVKEQQFDIFSYLMGKSGGGGGGSFPWFGPGTEKLDTKQQIINLADDTTWASWTPSTTEGTILAAPSAYEYEWDIDHTKYVYYLVSRLVTDVALKSTATLVKIPVKFGRMYVFEVYGVPKNAHQWESGGIGNTTSGSLSYNAIIYYRYDGELTAASSNAGPMFVSATIGAIVGDKIKVKRPDIKAVCSTAYFDTARAADIDADNTNMTIDIELYRTPIEGSLMNVELEKLRRAMFG